MSNFNDFRFKGLGFSEVSNKYAAIDRVSADGNKIIVKVADSHLVPTKYGFALVLDRTHVAFVKGWQVNRNWYGNEVLLDREYFTVKQWGEWSDFSDDDSLMTFDAFKNIAESQSAAIGAAMWAIHGQFKS